MRQLCVGSFDQVAVGEAGSGADEGDKAIVSIANAGPVIPLPVQTVRKATVGGIREARTAGVKPANAPIRMAEAMPPDHASTGITTAQPFELA
jgi:hypothetical protein